MTSSRPINDCGVSYSYIWRAAFTSVGQLQYSGGVLQSSTDNDTAAVFEIQLLGTPAIVVNPVPPLTTDILL